MYETYLQIMDYAAPYPGNFMRSILALDETLYKKRVRTIYIFPESAKHLYWINELILNKTIYFMEKSFFRNFMLLRKVVSSEKVKLIHVHFCDIQYRFMLSIFNILRKDIRLIMHHHNHWGDRSNIKDYVLRECFYRSTAHIGVSGDVTRELIRKGFDKNICFTAENAIDFDRLDKYKLKDSYNINQNQKVFLMFGFDFHRKGVDLVVNAIKNIIAKNNILLLIVFSVNHDDGVNRIAKILGEFPNWIKTLPPTDNIADYYDITDCFISASREEGFCYSIVEAAYCNCQSIISNIPGHRTDIPQIKIFGSENINGLEQRIIEVINEPSDITKKINNIQKDYVIKVYDLKTWVSSILSIYERVLNIRYG